MGRSDESLLRDVDAAVCGAVGIIGGDDPKGHHSRLGAGSSWLVAGDWWPVGAPREWSNGLSYSFGKKTRDERVSLRRIGLFIFSFAMVALGVETVVCARDVTHALGPESEVIPVIPWLPAIPWLAYLFGAILIVCGVALLAIRAVRVAALTLGSLWFLCSLVLVVPTYAANAGSMALRTNVFEPLAIARSSVASAGQRHHAEMAGARKPISAGAVSHGVWRGPFPGLDAYRDVDTGLDSLARILGRILRGRIHCCRVRYWTRPAGASRRDRYRPDVRNLGDHAASTQSAGVLWDSRGASRSRRVVQPFDCDRAVGRVVGLMNSRWPLARAGNCRPESVRCFRVNICGESILR